MESKRDPGIDKFIQLMRNLTQYLPRHPDYSANSPTTSRPSTSASTPKKSKVYSRASMMKIKN